MEHYIFYILYIQIYSFIFAQKSNIKVSTHRENLYFWANYPFNVSFHTLSCVTGERLRFKFQLSVHVSKRQLKFFKRRHQRADKRHEDHPEIQEQPWLSHSFSGTHLSMGSWVLSSLSIPHKHTAASRLPRNNHNPPILGVLKGFLI